MPWPCSCQPFQSSPERVESPDLQGDDGRLGLADRSSHFSGGQAGDEPQHQDLSLRLGKPPQLLDQNPLREDLAFEVDGSLRGVVEGGPPVTEGSPLVLGDDVAGDPEDPARERSSMLVAERRESLPGGEEDVLGSVLGVVVSPQARMGKSEDPLSVAIEKLSERIDVTAARPLDQVLEGGRASLLLPLYR
jgi:hypothetical protein